MDNEGMCPRRMKRSALQKIYQLRLLFQGRSRCPQSEALLLLSFEQAVHNIIALILTIQKFPI
jgi:hypothetical protein